MKDKDTIQSYINNFRRRISPILKPDTGLLCNIFPADSGGAILEFTISSGIPNEDKYQETSATVGEALGKINQHAFGGHLGGFNFSGTNVILEDNRIIFIKGDEREVWRDDAAQADLHMVVSKLKGSAK